jgi:hypothetical protein
VGDIFREIDEELKQEDYVRLWKKYGNHVMAGVLVIVLAIGGVYAWRQHQEQQRLQISNRYAEAQELAAAGKRDDAAALFANIAEQSGGGYRALSELQRAALRATSGDTQGAIAIYDTLAADSSVDRATRDLATILAVMHAIDLKSADAKSLDAKLTPLDVADGSWRHSARELRAMLAQQSGDAARAKQLYTQLADDVDAPEGIRARAAEMLATLGG